MNLQTDTAMRTLTELYGEAGWMTNPKNGQNLDAIFEQWDAELKKYNTTQIVDACRRVWKYRLKTFPQLGHILAELTDIEPDPDPDPADDEPVRRTRHPVAEYMNRVIAEGFEGRMCLASDFNRAYNAALDQIEQEFPETSPFEHRTASDLTNIGINNGVFWTTLEANLRRITAKRGAA